MVPFITQSIRLPKNENSGVLLLALLCQLKVATLHFWSFAAKMAPHAFVQTI